MIDEGIVQKKNEHRVGKNKTLLQIEFVEVHGGS